MGLRVHCQYIAAVKFLVNLLQPRPKRSPVRAGSLAFRERPTIIKFRFLSELRRHYERSKCSRSA
jgi:hypothetical protein